MIFKNHIGKSGRQKWAVAKCDPTTLFIGWRGKVPQRQYYRSSSILA